MIDFDEINTEKIRFERKFVTNQTCLLEVEEIIKINPSMFSEIFYKRRVNNIYLDSYDMSNYSRNVEGYSKRLKIRIRWYGKIFGKVERPILELKTKSGELGKKLSFPLKSFVLNDFFSKERLQEEIFEKSNLPRGILELLKLSQLSILNTYERKYFLSSNKKYRVTIDNNLQFFDIKSSNNIFKNKILDKEKIIVEIKYDKEYDKEVSRITQHMPFRLTKVSKYILGVDCFI
jgi:SPX domain protein involved in polyphosphate accumulation